MESYILAALITVVILSEIDLYSLSLPRTLVLLMFFGGFILLELLGFFFLKTVLLLPKMLLRHL